MAVLQDDLDDGHPYPSPWPDSNPLDFREGEGGSLLQGTLLQLQELKPRLLENPFRVPVQVASTRETMPKRIEKVLRQPGPGGPGTDMLEEQEGALGSEDSEGLGCRGSGIQQTAKEEKGNHAVEDRITEGQLLCPGKVKGITDSVSPPEPIQRQAVPGFPDKRAVGFQTDHFIYASGIPGQVLPASDADLKDPPAGVLQEGPPILLEGSHGPAKQNWVDPIRIEPHARSVDAPIPGGVSGQWLQARYD